MAGKTRLWYVHMRLEWRGASAADVVLHVTDRHPGCPDAICFRTITPSAAGRKYARHNLARRLAEVLVGPGTDGYDWDLVEKFSKQRPVIRVHKEDAEPRPKRG